MLLRYSQYIYREHRYVTIKVCTRNSVPVKRELSALQHLNSLPRTRHAGRPHVRTLLDQFELTHPEQAASSTPQSTDPVLSRPFQCLVHKPMLMSLFAFRNSLRGKKLPEDLLKLVLQYILTAVDYLHSEAKVIHTGSSQSAFRIFRVHTFCAHQIFKRRTSSSTWTTSPPSRRSTTKNKPAPSRGR